MADVEKAKLNKKIIIRLGVGFSAIILIIVIVYAMRDKGTTDNRTSGYGGSGSGGAGSDGAGSDGASSGGAGSDGAGSGGAGSASPSPAPSPSVNNFVVPPGITDSWTGCDKKYWGWNADGACQDAFGSLALSDNGTNIDCGKPQYGKPTEWFKAANYKCKQYKEKRTTCIDRRGWSYGGICEQQFGTDSRGGTGDAVACGDTWTWTYPCIVPK